MPVDQPGACIRAQHIPDGRLIDVHDDRGLGALVLFALRAQIKHLRASCLQRRGKEPFLPVIAPAEAAPFLVGRVLGAQRVPVHQQRPGAEQVHHRRVGQQSRPGSVAECLSQQEVAIAVHHVHGCSVARSVQQESGDDRVQGVREVVVPDPELEEVAEDVECVRARHDVLQECEERLIRGRPDARQVKVGN
jgi:hypothetical protein